MERLLKDASVQTIFCGGLCASSASLFSSVLVKQDVCPFVFVLGDLEEALGAASAIGDDRIMRQTRGTVVPDAFTHGTSAQRVRWFTRGFESGDPNQCETFKSKYL